MKLGLNPTVILPRSFGSSIVLHPASTADNPDTDSLSIIAPEVSAYQLCLPDKEILRDKLRELTELALEAGPKEDN